MKKDQGEAQEEEETGEVVAFEKMERPQRLKVRPDMDEEKREESDGESAAPTRNHGSIGEIGGRFGADEFMDERTGEQHDADEAEETGEEIGAAGKARFAGELQDVGGPRLCFTYGGGREKNADVRDPRNDEVLKRRIVGWNEVGRIFFQAGMFELADNDAGVRENFGDAVEKKIFVNDAVSRLQGSGRDGDDAGRTKLFGDTEGDGTAHGVACEDGAVGINHATSGESANERTGTAFGLSGRKWAGRTTVAGKIGDVDAETLFGKGPPQILHDNAVGRDSVKENDGAEFRGGRKIFALDGEDLHAAGGGVDDIAFFGITARRVENEAAAKEKKENTSESFIPLNGRPQRVRSSKMLEVRA